jgi:hypothetical protein
MSTRLEGDEGDHDPTEQPHQGGAQRDQVLLPGAGVVGAGGAKGKGQFQHEGERAGKDKFQ